jgi:hypothetical protein
MTGRATSRNMLQGRLDYWVYWLGLEPWKIDLIFFYRDIPDHPDALMTTVSDWRYMTATIRVSMDWLQHAPEKEIDRNILHELLHAVVCEMRNGEVDHEERVVTMLTNSFLWLSKEIEKNDKP